MAMHPALSSHDTRRLSSALAALLSPLAHRDGEVWRVTVARRVRDLVGAERAVFVVEQADTMRIYGVHMDWTTIREYQSHYWSLDYGTARQRRTGIEVWSRRMLWDPDVLERSEYYNDFALPNQLHETVGLATSIRPLRARVRIAVFNARSPLRPPRTEQQLSRLSLILSAFKAGILMHLRWGPWRARLISALDDSHEPLAICDANGRVLHENAALARTLPKLAAQGVLEAIRQVARSVSAAANGRTADGPIAREVVVAGERYQIHGSVAGPEYSTFGVSALVSVTRQSASPLTASPADAEEAHEEYEHSRFHDEELRSLYRLTAREVEVTRLLLRRRTNAEVAHALTISEHTARHHTENVLLKLGVHSRKDVEKMLIPVVERRGETE
jgi:DNA-binding CsgD family transcriptional regulator/PAS domain-containing protein